VKHTSADTPASVPDGKAAWTPQAPFALGIAPTYALVLVALTSWWWTMSLLFTSQDVIAGSIIAYAFPGLIAVVSLLASMHRGRGEAWTAAPFAAMGVLAAAFVAFDVGYSYGNSWRPNLDLAAFLGIAFIAGAVSLMLYPLAGLHSYFEYKDPRFIGGVIFMPLFIYLSVIFQASLEWDARTALTIAGFAGFWLSGAWLASHFTQGSYVSGLEIRPTFAFRPDIILPGGVQLVKGIVLTGVGLMLMFQPELVFPKWNWWGFVLAFWGIITIIPLRGMYKLVVGRRRRLLGIGGKSHAFIWAKESLLFLGLLLLLYGFINAFMGTVPFLALRPQPQTFWGGLLLFLFSFLVLVPFRGYSKTIVPEGTETYGFLVMKAVLLYLGIVLLMYSMIAWFMGAFLVPQLSSNPVGFALGIGLLLLGGVLILVLRPMSLDNEFRATVRIMVGILADAPEAVREKLMRERLQFLARCPENQRNRQVAMMVAAVRLLPEDKRSRVLASQIKLLAGMSPNHRGRLMGAMDVAMTGEDG
jgi:hypothetical protein